MVDVYGSITRKTQLRDYPFMWYVFPGKCGFGLGERVDLELSDKVLLMLAMA